MEKVLHSKYESTRTQVLREFFIKVFWMIR